MARIPEQDAISGQSTTGHEWDGIAELNTPLPKWWVMVFYVTIAWAVGYWIVYPSFPVGDGFLKGVLGYSSRKDLEGEVEKARKAHEAEQEALAAESVGEIYADDALRAYAIAGGAVLFKRNCAACHQAGGAGSLGFPTLADDEWIWGGGLEDIHTTLRHGVRWSEDEDTRSSQMPAFAEVLEDSDIQAVAQYVKDMSMGVAAAGPGRDIYVENCAVCHSSDGESAVSDGGREFGAPALGNAVWLYAAPGGEMTVEAIASQVRAPRHGVMPAWSGRLSEAQIKMLTVYVYSLGGGF